MLSEQDPLFLALLFEAIGEAVIAIDADSRIVLWNPAAEVIYGWDRTEVQGREIGELLKTVFEDPTVTRERAVESVRREGIWRGVVRQVRKDGTEVIIDSTVRLYSHPLSGVSGMVAVNRDISDKEKLRVTLGRLEYLNRVLLRQLTLDEIFNTYVDQIREIISADEIELWLLNDASSQVTVARRYARQSTGHLASQSSPLKETPLGLVSLTREALVIPDLVERVHFTQRGLLPPGIRSLMLLPLLEQKKIAGGIAFFAYSPGRFSPHDVDLLISTTEQFNLALMQIRLVDTLKAQAEENARLFQQAQENAQMLEALSHKLIRLQERERAQLSREFHDEIGQSLTAVFLHVRSALAACQQQPPAVTEALRDSIEILSRLMEQVRSISLDLHPKILEDLGFIPALRWLVNRTARLAQAEAHFNPQPGYIPLASEVEFELFRIVQEALTNVLRHAAARHIFLSLTQDDDAANLVVTDDGRGFAGEYTSGLQLPTTFFGLHSMFARAALAGAHLSVTSQPGSGCTVKVRVPYERSD